MSKQFHVGANGTSFGFYPAETAQEARDACARDAGYASEADMSAQLERPSELIAEEASQTELAKATILREWWNGAEDRQWNDADMECLSFEERDGGVEVEDDQHLIKAFFRDGKLIEPVRAA